MEKGKIATWIAVIGLVTTVLSFYYSRRDKAQEEQEKVAENRPLLSFQDGQLLGSEFSNGSELYEGAFKVANNGKRVAANTTIFLKFGQFSLVSPNRDTPIGDIAPEQTAQATMRVAFPFYEYAGRGQVRFEGTLRYSDKNDPSKHFDEPFCLGAPVTIPSLLAFVPPAEPRAMRYDPPLQIAAGCTGVWLGPRRRLK